MGNVVMADPRDDPLENGLKNPLESWNKSVRAFQYGVGAWARQTSSLESLISNPIIASKCRHPLCKICGERGNTAWHCKHKTCEDHIFE